MNVYLKAKHWQLFTVFFGLIILGQSLMASSIINGDAFNPLLLMIPTLIVGMVFFGWLWAIATACSKVLPNELYSSPGFMRAGLIYALVYVVFSGVFFFGSGPEFPGYMIIMHLLAMAAIFYALGFTAKQLTKLEQKKDVSFYNYSGPFFLFWFFPVGVWFIQPKVNQLLGEKP
ncbi:MAG: hypothetical protein SV201_00240 [Pseudomonadota bacterium]|nr:hypothetical protein [Pseudomonadota bacterium]